MILNLIGGGGSGKTILKLALIKTGNFRGVVPYTTRPKRDGEINGVHYYFVTFEQFAQQEFIVSRMANKYYYGVKKSDIVNVDSSSVIVTTFDVNGVRLLVGYGLNIKVVFLDIDEITRKNRMVSRGDNGCDIEARLLIDRDTLIGIAANIPVLRISHETVEESVKIVESWCLD